VYGKSGKIGSLFIDEKHQKHGLGKRLVELAEKQFIKSGIKNIKIRSSLHSVDFYEKIDYKKTTGKRRMLTGIIFQPMQKYLPG
jgi:histone acetyltransferase (RNA polymerase elongator complex component)